jgi:hypothetical protein
MTAVTAIWKFVAGDSRIAPLGIALALGAGALGVRLGWPGAATGAVLAGLLTLTLAAAAFERS